MVIVGLVLALAGIKSVRIALVAAGSGATWLVADAFHASTATGLILAAAGGFMALVVAMVAARLAFFAVGAVVGVVVGARLFGILDTGESSILLATVFIPAVAVVGAVVLNRWRERLVGWATAVAGSALVLSGLGRLAPDSLGFLREPEGSVGQVTATALWVALAVVGRASQKRAARVRATVPATPG